MNYSIIYYRYYVFQKFQRFRSSKVSTFNFSKKPKITKLENSRLSNAQIPKRINYISRKLKLRKRKQFSKIHMYNISNFSNFQIPLKTIICAKDVSCCFLTFFEVILVYSDPHIRVSGGPTHPKILKMKVFAFSRNKIEKL